MRKSISFVGILLSCMLYSTILNAQISNCKVTYSDPTTSTVRLMLDLKKNYFSLIKYEETESNDVIKSFHLGGGYISWKGNNIICLDKRKNIKYKLKYLNEEIILNQNIPYLKDTLYIINKSDKDFPIYIGNWKNSKKDGYWYYFKNGIKTQTRLYKEGILMEIENEQVIKNNLKSDYYNKSGF